MAIQDQPTDSEFSELEARGYAAFWDGHPVRKMNNAEEERGWWLAHRRVYGQGMRASYIDTQEETTTDNPYPEFSPWSEAWGRGYEEEREI